jgi:hypothetical protein
VLGSRNKGLATGAAVAVLPLQVPRDRPSSSHITAPAFGRAGEAVITPEAARVAPQAVVGA